MNRTLVKSLQLSAAGLIALAVGEHFMGDAYIPIKGDVPTIGFGTTKGVKIGDKITPVRALIRLNEDVTEKEEGLKKCFGEIALYQYEWDAYVELAYNVGAGAVCFNKKTGLPTQLLQKLRKGDYAGACKEILDFNKAGGVYVQGLANRREREYKKCMGLK